MPRIEPTGDVKAQGSTVQHVSTGLRLGNGFYIEPCVCVLHTIKMAACWTGGLCEGQVASSLQVHRRWLPCGVSAPHWLGP